MWSGRARGCVAAWAHRPTQNRRLRLRAQPSWGEEWHSRSLSASRQASRRSPMLRGTGGSPRTRPRWPCHNPTSPDRRCNAVRRHAKPASTGVAVPRLAGPSHDSPCRPRVAWTRHASPSLALPHLPRFRPGGRGINRSQRVGPATPSLPDLSQSHTDQSVAQQTPNSVGARRLRLRFGRDKCIKAREKVVLDPDHDAGLPTSGGGAASAFWGIPY